MHVLDVTGLQWSQPLEDDATFDVSGNHIKAKGGNKEAPSPRGAHSATLIGDMLYIVSWLAFGLPKIMRLMYFLHKQKFGGYGGLGFGRKDFNDLYSLNLSEWTWDRIKGNGKPPEGRSGHSACNIRSKIYVYGGWSASK